MLITTALVAAAICLAVLAAGGCSPGAPDDAKGDCVEFDHHTLRAGRAITCRMVWCQGVKMGSDYSAGVATLWCDDPPAAPTPPSASGGASVHLPGVDVQIGGEVR